MIHNGRYIRNMEGAVFNFIRDMNMKEGVLNVSSVNNKFDRIVTTQKSKYYVKFKREFFNTFNEQFRKFISENPEYSSLGESINKESLEQAIKTGCEWVIIIYKDGKMYRVNPRLWMNFAVSNNLIRTQEKENTFTRDDMSGNKETVNETTCSIPLKLMERI